MANVVDCVIFWQLSTNLKCHYGFSKNDFSRKLINGKQDKNGFVVCQQFTFKIRPFGFTAAQTDARERTTSKEEQAKWPESFTVVYMQELLSKPRAQSKLSQGYPSDLILLQIV